MSSFIRPQDIADILIMSFLVYQLYRWFKNTKALQVVMGIGFLVVLYLVTKNLDLFMTSWILQELGTVLFILIIVIFQAEIRQALYRFSLLRNLFGREVTASGRLDLMDLSSAIFQLAAARTGAIVVFQREEPLDEYLMHGVQLDSLVSAQLLRTIFTGTTPLHDGAVVIKDNRITQASCHLPMSANTDLPQHLGTRHRSGLGLSERSDAAVIIVSEERGEVSLAVGGEMVLLDTAERLSERLNVLLTPKDQETVRLTMKQKFLGNLRPKAITVLLVLISWLVVTARQGSIETVTVPVKFHNLPDNLVLMKSSPEEVEVRVRALSKLIASPKEADIVTDVDLGRIREGSNRLTLTKEHVQLPLGMVASEINPSVIRVVAEKKVRKNLKVKPQTMGVVAAGKVLRKIEITPAQVTVEGPEHAVSQLDSVTTEEIDVSGLRRSTVVQGVLLQPAPNVHYVSPEPVRVHLVIASRRPGGL